MRIIILTLLMLLTLEAKNIGVVITDNDTINYSDELKSEIEQLFATQAENFQGENTLNVFIDREKKVKTIYQRSGATGLIAYAKKNAYDSIALVEFKRGAKMLSFVLLVADETVQDRKSVSLAFASRLQREITPTIVSAVLRLNYELGVLNVKTVY